MRWANIFVIKSFCCFQTLSTYISWSFWFSSRTLLLTVCCFYGLLRVAESFSVTNFNLDNSRNYHSQAFLSVGNATSSRLVEMELKMKRYKRVNKLVIKAQISIEEEKMEMMMLRVAWVNSKVLLAYSAVDIYL